MISPSPSTPFIPTRTGCVPKRATLEQQEARDQTTTNQQATLANAAHQTEVELASQQSEITGELAVAVAQQQAAQAAAAAAAVRAAQAKAAAGSGHLDDASQPPSAHLHGTTGKCRRHVVGRPVAASLPPMRPAGRVRRQLRRRLARVARTWAVSNSARRRGTQRPNWPACRSSSTSPRTRRLRPSRTTSPSRSTRPTASSPGTTPAGRADAGHHCALLRLARGHVTAGPVARLLPEAEQVSRGRWGSSALCHVTPIFERRRFRCRLASPRTAHPVNSRGEVI